MNRALVWFAVLYGELMAAVVLVVIGGYWVDSQSGQRFCGVVGLDSVMCKGAIGILVLFSTGYSVFVSFRRFMMARKEIEGKGKEESNS